MSDEPTPLTTSELAELRYEVQWYSSDHAFSRDVVCRLLATVAALQMDVDRLRARTHEIQAEESQRNADLESRLAVLRQCMDAGRRWVDAGEWRRISSVNAYALGAQQERITVLQEALRYCLPYAAHALAAAASYPHAEYERGLLRQFEALLGDVPVDALGQQPAAPERRE